MPSITVHGARISYEDTGGAGAPVLFAHGLLWSGRMFAPQIEALRSERRCVSFDFRGQGASETTADGYDMDTLFDDAAALIDALGLAPCHFVGLSMGGFVGLRLAAYRPELLRSLTLVASAADEEPRANLTKYRALAAGVRLLGARAFVSRLMPVMFGESFLRDPARGDERQRCEAALAAVEPVGGVRATYGVLERRSVAHLLPSIRVPTQVLAGDEDRAVTPARGRATAARIAGARFVAIPRAGHTTSLENPEAVSEALRAFFASVERP